jgi:hypothetical protein
VAAAVLLLGSGGVRDRRPELVEAAYRRGVVLVGERATTRWNWVAGRVTVAVPDATREFDAAQDVRDTRRAEVSDFVTAVGEGPRRARRWPTGRPRCARPTRSRAAREGRCVAVC